MRRLLAPLLTALVVTGCAGASKGPTSPADIDRLRAVDGTKDAGARVSAQRFVSAYAGMSAADQETLAALAGTDLMRGWVHWIGVQRREFPGVVTATANIDVGPAAPFSLPQVPGSDQFLRELEVRGAVSFNYVPTDGKAFELTHPLDGPMRLVEQSDGAWQVLDFTRDGIPLSQQFELPQDATGTAGGVRVILGAFQSVPGWQFGLIVQSVRRVKLRPGDVTLVDRAGTRVAEASAITNSLETIAAGTQAEGFAGLPAQGSADGLRLRLAFRGPRAGVVLVPLSEVIHPLAIASPSPSPGG